MRQFKGLVRVQGQQLKPRFFAKIDLPSETVRAGIRKASSEGERAARGDGHVRQWSNDWRGIGDGDIQRGLLRVAVLQRPERCKPDKAMERFAIRAVIPYVTKQHVLE